MRISSCWRGVTIGAVALTLAAGVVVAGPAAQAAPSADYQMPFSCNQEWYGSTRSYHSPSARAVDFNRDGDFGKVVLAAAPGIVSSATDLGNTSYGRYIKISHGNNEYTYYAHLDTMYVTAGQRVDKGQVIGTVGTSGGSTGPHLHFEERNGSTVVTANFDGKTYVMPQTSRSRNCVHVPIAGDWNNDGRDDIGVFAKRWRGIFKQKLASGVTRLKLGRGLDWPLIGDWNGDDRIDVGLKRALDGTFILRSSGSNDRSISLGGRGDVGLAGDWSRDGKTDVGIFRPSTGEFRLRWPNGGVRTLKHGTKAMIPVTGDFNGNGRWDIGVYDPTNASWSLRAVSRRSRAWRTTVTAGKPGELPVTGDWNKDGSTDLGTWNRKTGAFTLSYFNTPNPRTLTRYFGAQPR